MANYPRSYIYDMHVIVCQNWIGTICLEGALHLKVYLLEAERM